MDNNKLKELPNRLTLAPELTMLSVCVNRLLLLILISKVEKYSIFLDRIVSNTLRISMIDDT